MTRALLSKMMSDESSLTGNGSAISSATLPARRRCAGAYTRPIFSST